MKNVDMVDFNHVVPDGDFASPKDETLVPVIKNNLIANKFSPSNKEHDNSVIRSSTMIHPDNNISSNKNIVIKDYESEIGDDTFSSEENTLNFKNENDIGSSIPEAIQSSNSLKVEESEPVGTGIIEVTKIIKDVDSLEFERDHSDHDNNHHISKEGREITAHKHYTSQEKAFNDFKITTNIFEVKDIEFPPLRKSSISKNDGRNQFANMNGIVIGDYDAIEKDFNDFKSTTNIFEVKDLEFPLLRKSIDRNINHQNVNTEVRSDKIVNKNERNLEENKFQNQNVNTEVHSDKIVNKNERNLENKFQKLPHDTSVTNQKSNQRKTQRSILLENYSENKKDFNDFKRTTNIFEVKDLEFPSLRKSIERNINYQNVNTEVHSDKMVNKNERNLENKFQKLPTGVTNRKLNQRKAQTNNLKAADLKIQHRSESIDDDRESNHQEQHTSFDDYGESNQQEQHTSDDGESYQQEQHTSDDGESNQQEQHTSMFKRMNVEEQLRVDEL